MDEIELLAGPRFQGRGSYQEGGRLAADYIADEFERVGLTVVRQPIDKGAENIFGIRQAGKKAVILAAHFDHLGVDSDGTMYPGADDNASGVAALLGIARDTQKSDSEHTLIFAAFGAEEDGLVGSRVFIHNPIWPLADIIAMINFDLIGRSFFEAGLALDSTVGAIGFEEDQKLQKRIGAFAETLGLRIFFIPASLLEAVGIHDRTDDWWFRRQRIPAYHFTTGHHYDYHKPTDTSDKVKAKQVEKIARVGREMVRILINEY